MTNEREIAELALATKQLTKTVGVIAKQTAACMFMIKMLNAFIFEQSPNPAKNKKAFNEDVLRYVEIKYADHPDFIENIKILLGEDSDGDEDLTDLMSEFIS